MRDVITAALTDAAGALAALMADDVALGNIEKGAEAMANTLRQGGRVLSCGNGGSLCEASHFAEELTGRFRRDRRPLAAMAINDPGHMTCVANDIGFDEVFARGVEAHGRRGDTLLAISTSGRSANVVKAATRARGSGMVVVAVTGKRGSPLAELADIEICTPAGPFSDRVQELHVKVIHLLVELIERNLVPESYKRAAP
jgi:D-sedoheptulose 7-phosphate isomerase